MTKQSHLPRFFTWAIPPETASITEPWLRRQAHGRLAFSLRNLNPVCALVRRHKQRSASVEVFLPSPAPAGGPGFILPSHRSIILSPNSEIKMAGMRQDVGAETVWKNRRHTRRGLVRFFQTV